MRHAILAAVLGAIVLAGCGGDDTADQSPKTTTAAAAASAAAAAPATTIRISDFVFEPSAATVRAGRRIAVPNADSAPHTLTEQPAGGEPAFDTGTVRGRQQGSFTAPAPGTYKVVCELHPFMKGEIKVVS